MRAYIRPFLQKFTCEHRPLFNESFSPGFVSRTIQGPPRAQSPFARSRFYLNLASRQKALPLLHRSYGLMRQPKTLQLISVSLYSWSFSAAAADCQPLLGNGPSRGYLCNPCMGAWTTTTGCLSGAFVRFFPES